MTKGIMHAASTLSKSAAQNCSIEHTAVIPSLVLSCRSLDNFWFHLDTVGSISFHPLMASLLSVSGSRHFLEDDDDDDSSTSDEEPTSINNHTVRRRERPRPVTVDASIKIWNFEPSGA